MLKGVAGQFGCGQMTWKYVFISGFMHFFGGYFGLKLCLCTLHQAMQTEHRILYITHLTQLLANFALQVYDLVA